MKTALIVFAVVSLVGCEEYNPIKVMGDDLNGRNVSMSGAGVVLASSSKPYNSADLADLISTSYGGKPAPDHNSSGDSVSDQIRLQNAISAFGNDLYNPPTNSTSSAEQNKLRDARNQVQGMVLATSANRCNQFKLALREKSTNISFGLGALSTVLGAAGAVFTNGSSQIFSALSGSASGVNAEYNKDIMSNVTSSVIIPGIDQQRSAILQEIANRRCLGVSSYPLSWALTDAVRYHSACSTDVGVAAASSALSKSSSPSLSDAKATVDAINALRASIYVKGEAPPIVKPTPGAKPPAAKPPPAPTAEAETPGSTDPAADAQKDTAQTTPHPVLLGDPIGLLQCPSLQADGTLLTGIPTQASTAGVAGQIPYGLR